VLDEQRVAIAATRGREHDRLVYKGVLTDEVEEVLEDAGVGSAVRRRPDDNDVCRLHRGERGGGLGSECGAAGAGQSADEAAEFDDLDGCVKRLRKLPSDRVDERRRSRGNGQAAADSDNADAMGRSGHKPTIAERSALAKLCAEMCQFESILTSTG